MEGVKASRHILVGVDRTEESVKAVRWVVDNMQREGDLIHVLHVIPSCKFSIIGEDGSMPVVTEDHDAEQREQEEAEGFVQEKLVPILLERQATYQVEFVKYMTDCESMGKAICKRAEELQAVLVVLTSHNKGPIKEFFMGSVTKYCTHHCARSVLVLH